MSKKPRKLIDERETREFYLSYYGRTVNVEVGRKYSSFPSQSSLFYPDKIEEHNLTALRFVEGQSVKLAVSEYGHGTHVNGAPDNYLLPSGEFNDYIKIRAMNKAIEEFMDGKQQLAADFAERQQTIDMIAKRSRQALTVLRHVRKGNLYKAVKVLKGGKKPVSKKLASLRLEYAYGWAPLVGSIFDLCDKEFPPDPEIVIDAPFGQLFSQAEGMRQTSGKVRSSYKMTVVMTSPLVSSAEKLGLTNPASVAWEVVPFSFVVDWFLPVSTYLQSLTAFSGFRIESHCHTYSHRLLCEYSDNKLGVGRHMARKFIERNVHVPPRYDLRFKNPLSVAHALNALALIRVLRKN